MVLQSWIIDCPITHKIFDEVIKIITKTMKNRKVELTLRGTTLDDVKIKRGIIEEDVLSFIAVMMPLNHILRKYLLK